MSPHQAPAWILCVLCSITFLSPCPVAGDTCDSFEQADANNDGAVDPLDVGYVFSRFGCPVGSGDPACDSADANGDGAADPLDSGFVLARLGCESEPFNGLFFGNPEFPLSGSTLSSIVLDDFDDDDDLDAAMVVQESDWISVVLNLGDGSFAPEAIYPVGDRPESLDSADFDGDGDVDLVVVNNYDDNLSILSNQGDGTFEDSLQLNGVGENPTDVAAEDLDVDGDIDLVVTYYSDAYVAVLRNRGDGDFVNDLIYEVGRYPESVAIGDLDGNGAPDLIVSSPYSADPTLLVFLNHGDGTFSSGESLETLDEPLRVSLGDLDLDGDLDLALISTEPWSSYEGTFSLLFNQGDGTFSEEILYETGDSEAVGLADLNQDGALDLAVINHTQENVVLLVNDGSGTFIHFGDCGTGRLPVDIALGDLDGDQDIDLATLNYATTFGILINDGGGNLACDLTYPTGRSPTSVMSGDLNGDAYTDLAVANFSDHSISLLLNTGKGDLVRSDVVYSDMDNPQGLATGDLDGDGDSDLVAANYNSNTVSVLMNKGDGTFIDDVTYGVSSGPSAVVIGDWDGDDDFDLAVANKNAPFGYISVLLNDGTGTFADDVLYSTGDDPFHITASDFDGDGYTDLAIANEDSGNLAVLVGVGDGTFAAAVFQDVDGNVVTGLAVEDLNGDGYPDLAVTSYSSDLQGLEIHWVTLLVNDGIGGFARSSLTIGQAWNGLDSALAIGDLDLDSDLDLAVTIYDYNSVLMLLNNGNAEFVENFSYGVGDLPTDMILHDVDGDSDPELVTTNQSDANISVLFNRRIP